MMVKIEGKEPREGCIDDGRGDCEAERVYLEEVIDVAAPGGIDGVK